MKNFDISSTLRHDKWLSIELLFVVIMGTMIDHTISKIESCLTFFSLMRKCDDIYLCYAQENIISIKSHTPMAQDHCLHYNNKEAKI